MFSLLPQVYEALVEEKGKNFLFVRLSRQTVDDLGLAVDQDFPAEVRMRNTPNPLDGDTWFVSFITHRSVQSVFFPKCL